MNRGNFSRSIPIILIVIIVIIAIAAIVSVGRSIFGGGTSSEPTEVDRGRSALVATDVMRSVRLTERGPIVADEEFRSYQITVTPTSRTMTIYEGYLENAIDERSYPNNTPAYEEFVHALDRGGMMLGKNLPTDRDDTRGVCATGHVYEYETLQSERTVRKLWTSDCRDSRGSLDAKQSYLNELFNAQIPDSRELLRQIN